jgi:hypothetical protein
MLIRAGPKAATRRLASANASPSNVRDELKRLVDLGILDAERPEDSARIYYVRTNSRLWEIIATAAAALEGD